MQHRKQNNRGDPSNPVATITRWFRSQENGQKARWRQREERPLFITAWLHKRDMAVSAPKGCK